MAPSMLKSLLLAFLSLAIAESIVLHSFDHFESTAQALPANENSKFQRDANLNSTSILNITRPAINSSAGFHDFLAPSSNGSTTNTTTSSTSADLSLALADLNKTHHFAAKIGNETDQTQLANSSLPFINTTTLLQNANHTQNVSHPDYYDFYGPKPLESYNRTRRPGLIFSLEAPLIQLSIINLDQIHQAVRVDTSYPNRTISTALIESLGLHYRLPDEYESIQLLFYVGSSNSTGSEECGKAWTFEVVDLGKEEMMTLGKDLVKDLGVEVTFESMAMWSDEYEGIVFAKVVEEEE